MKKGKIKRGKKNKEKSTCRILISVGLGLIGLGAYIQISAKSYLDFLSDNYLNTPILIIILGQYPFIEASCCTTRPKSLVQFS